MTGFDSKRNAAQRKVNDEADTLSLVYQRGFADGKRAAQPEQKQKLVANMTVEDGRISFAARILADGTYDLYTTLPAAQRKPLTEEEISNIWDDTVAATVIPFSTGFARAIEAAHNIKE
jgi:hypothetical protein